VNHYYKTTLIRGSIDGIGIAAASPEELFAVFAGIGNAKVGRADLPVNISAVSFAARRIGAIGSGRTGMTTLATLTATLGPLAVPALFGPLLARARGRIPSRRFCFLAILVCLAPLAAPWPAIGRLSPLSVWLVAVAGAVVMLRSIDWLARPRYENDLIRVWLALTVWPGLEIEDVAVPLASLPQRCRLVRQRLAAGFACSVCGLALAALGQRLGVPDRGLLLDNSCKVLEIYLLASGGNHLLVASFAIAGYRVFDAFRYPILAHSVLDFWSRYNVWIHRWFKRNIFRPIARRWHRPAAGILAVFAISGIAHEYLFLPVAPELLGWQLTFFGIHGLGALAGIQLGRAFQVRTGRRVPRPLAIATTLAFVLATTPLFIHCLDAIVDLHRDLGGWLLRNLGTTT
jgi:Membrane bound O-acyl transferase family